MVIDFHTHVFPDKIAERAIASLVASANGAFPPCHDGTLDGLLRNMDAFGVDISVLQPVVTKPSSFLSTNRWVADIHNEKIVAFGGLHPATDNYKRDIDTICGLGCKGIKLHPEYQNFIVDDPAMFPIYDYALSKGLILLIHAGFDPAYQPPFRSNPKMFRHVIDEMKGGTIVAAHLGGQQQWDEVENYLCGTDLYLDTSMGFSHYPSEQFLRIVKSHGADKILFGSDSPWSRADHEISALRSLPLTEEEKDLILFQNAKRLLNR